MTTVIAFVGGVMVGGMFGLLMASREEDGKLVRCKDCKYSSPNNVYGCRLEPFDVNERGERMYSNDYCSRAERRTDG